MEYSFKGIQLINEKEQTNKKKLDVSRMCYERNVQVKEARFKKLMHAFIYTASWKGKNHTDGNHYQCPGLGWAVDFDDKGVRGTLWDDGTVCISTVVVFTLLHTLVRIVY